MRVSGSGLASRADHCQMKAACGVARLVEALDRMRPERRRYRGVARHELGAVVRIVGDEGVDELRRSDLLLAFAAGEPVEAQVIAATPQRAGDDRREAQEFDEARAGFRAEETAKIQVSYHRSALEIEITLNLIS